LYVFVGLLVGWLIAVSSISIPGGHKLHPVKEKGGGSFVKSVDQNFPPIYHWAIYTLNKTTFYFTGHLTPLTTLPHFPICFTSPIFQSTFLTKFSPYFSLGNRHPWQNSSLEKGKSPQGRGTWDPKMEGVTLSFDSRFGEIEATDWLTDLMTAFKRMSDDVHSSYRYWCF